MTLTKHAVTFIKLTDKFYSTTINKFTTYLLTCANERSFSNEALSTDGANPSIAGNNGTKNGAQSTQGD